jgi:WD40 repeat protein
VLTPLFCLLAWAKEPITEGTMKVLLQTHHLAGTQRWDELFRRALEHGHLMLQRRPTSDGEAGWTIYHDSFRQHLLESGTVSASREWAQERWLEVCKDWKVLAFQEPSLYRYVLRHYVAHLLDSGNLQEAVEILTDVEFIEFRARVDLLQHLIKECETLAEKISDISQREMLYTIASAIAIEMPTLRRFPELTFQTLVNSCRWVDATWTQSLIQGWISAWKSSGRGVWLERLLPPREIPRASPIVKVLTDSFGCKALAFSNDGKYLAGAGNREVIVWEVESGKEVCVLEVPRFVNGGFIDIAWSEDNRWIAAIGDLEGYLAFWDFKDKTLKFFEKVHEHGCTVAFCPRELRDPFYSWDLLTCGRDSFRLWFIQEDQDKVLKEALFGEKLRFIQDMLGDAIPWKPPLAGAVWARFEGQQVIVVATEAGQIVLLKNGVTPIAGSNPGLPIHHVSATEDGRFIAIVQDADEPPIPIPGVRRIGNDHCFILIDNEQEQDITGYRLKRHIAKVSLLASENRLLTCEKDTGMAILWSLVPFKMIGSWQGPSIGLEAGALGKGNRIAVSTKIGSVLLLNPKAMSGVQMQDSMGCVWSMSISPDGNSIVAARTSHYLASHFVGDVALVNLKDRNLMLLESFEKRNAALSTAYLPDGRFITGHMDGTIRIWSSEGVLISKHLIRENVGIAGICVNKNGDLIAISCGSWYDYRESPGTIHILRTGDMSEVFTDKAGKKGYGGKPGSPLAFGGEDDIFLVCGGSPIRVWKKSDFGWEIEAEIENDFGVIGDIAWSPYLVGFVFCYGSGSGGGIGLLRLTRTGWQKTVARAGKIILGLGISECGQFVAFADAERVCRFCRFEDDGSITILAKHFIHSASEVFTAIVSWKHKLIAFGDTNGDIHVFRYIANKEV